MRSINCFTQRTKSPAARSDSSRTRTQAIAVPVTALIATTMSEAVRVSLRAAIASGLVAASQNVDSPPSNARVVIAASGIRTIRVM